MIFLTYKNTYSKYQKLINRKIFKVMNSEFTWQITSKMFNFAAKITKKSLD